MARQTIAITAALMAAAGSIAGGIEWRTIDGSNNNLANPNWGRAGAQLVRICPAAYSDGVSAMNGENRPNPRIVSGIMNQADVLFNARGLTDWVWQWGQFMDHDFSLTSAQSTPAFIEVPQGDPIFDPNNLGGQVIGFRRSNFDATTGTDVNNPRNQTNTLTAYVDGSVVYGSTAGRAAWLRTGSGGRMKINTTSVGDLLPFNDGSQTNSFVGNDSEYFVAGENRVNEQAGLATVHTLVHREHNRVADLIAANSPGLSDEEIYQYARRIVGAEIQVITYGEWLEALLGQDPLPAYTGYNPNANAGIAHEFSAVAFRFGHTMLSPFILRLDANGEVMSSGYLPLRDAFHDISSIVEEGIDPIVRGLAGSLMQEIDARIIDDVRNFLFANTPPFHLDLMALNFQRARDHGLPHYNAMRQEFGLPVNATFADITSDVEIQNGLAAVYGDTSDMDPFICAMAEDHLPGKNVGELMNAILVDQFVRTRDGDRFWWQNDAELPGILAAAGLDMNWLESRRFSGIIRDTSGVQEIQNNAFRLPLTGDIDDNGVVAFTDLNLLLDDYGQNGVGLGGDIDNDGDVDFSDLNLLLGNYGASYN